MSIKDLFLKDQQVLNIKPEEVYDQIESKEFIDKSVEQKQEFIPQLDFSKPENFARFGRAEDYYTYAYEHIQKNYPYDGSEKEITEWKNGLTYLEKYVFENIYPKTTGYLTFNANTIYDGVTTGSVYVATSSTPQYVTIKAGPNSGDDVYRDGNLYDPANNRNSNFALTPDDGNTLEFWFKLNNGLPDSLLSCSFGVFDLFNPLEGIEASRILVDVTPVSGAFRFTYLSDGDGVQDFSFIYEISELTNWHHYAFSAKNDDDDLKICFYVDGNLKSEQIIAGEKITSTNNIGLIANIGAYRVSPVDDLENQGAVPGSIDELRFWKTTRGQRDIKRYRFDRVYGGSNTDLSNVDLGAYYRFNEGIFSTTSYDSRDSLILDYSGRISNGTLINGDLSVRQTGSAIDLFGKFESLEPKDPIIFNTNPLVQESLQNVLIDAIVWDENNKNAIYNSLPEWILSEDQEKDLTDLKKLCQIIASYFDKLYLQIKFLPKNEYKDYVESGQKPAPFTNTILESNGFVTPDIFIDSSIIESINSRDEQRIFEEKIYDLKNLIYKNIYNNLNYIYKTKGTEKSFRNLIRCFGVDDELIKLNIYANNTQYALENNKKDTVIKKRLLNLSTYETYNSSVYSTDEIDGGSEGFSFVKPTIEGLSASLPPYIVPLTFETEIYFPKKLNVTDDGYITPNSSIISLFGGNTVNNTASNNDYTINSTSGLFGFDVSLQKNDVDGRGGVFKFTNLSTGETISSSYFYDIYEGDKWNFAVRLKVPYENFDKLTYDPNALNVTPAGDDYRLELYGVSVVENNIKNEFMLSSSALTLEQVKDIHAYAKRFYVGAKKQNFTGSLINPTDIKVSFARLWFDYLDNFEIKEHGKDPFNVGRTNPLNKHYQVLGEKLEDLNTLVFNWDFDTLTGTNGSGKLFVLDSKAKKDISGSLFETQLTTKYPAIVRADENNSEIVNYSHTLIARQQLPENLYSSNTINILGESDFAFTRDTRPISLYWSFEKSMYQTISEEILNTFAGIVEFNTLIGAPINKFRDEYRDLAAIRTKFFNKVENTPSLEKYLEYYKWIDSSIGLMINQLSPAGAAVSDSIRNIVEDHGLERSKVKHQVSRFRRNDLSYAQVKGIKELKYDWRSGHAPEDLNNIVQEDSALWLKERAERTNSTIFTQSGADTEKQTILNSIINETNKPVTRVFDANTSVIYDRTTYYDRKLARIVDPVVQIPAVPSDTIDVYDVKNVKDTLDNTVELRPITSGSDYARTSLFNQPRANYSKEYQIFNAAGREVNKKHFVEIEGVYSASQPSTFISGVYDRQLPEMGRYEGIMVNRFSSPGTPETQGRGFLDKESESLSPYNTINYRNSIVRNNLNTWMRQTSYKTYYTGSAASYHKIKRNILRLPNTIVGLFFGNQGLFYDNGFITHQIPRRDYFYNWITSSTKTIDYSSGQYSSNYPNLTIKNLGLLSGSYENNQIIDFVGLADSAITKSYDQETLTKTFEPATELHKVILKENGPYMFPSWKQIRGNDNVIADKLSKNNKFLKEVIDLKPQANSLIKSKIIERNFQVEPVIEWNMPLGVTALLLGGFSNFFPQNNPSQEDYLSFIYVEFSNVLDWIANPILRNYIKYNGKQTVDTISYKKIFNLYTSEITDENEPIFSKITYSEIVYPKKEHVSLGKFRNKDVYSETSGFSNNGYDRNVATIRTFWHDRLEDRARTSASGSNFAISGSGVLSGTIDSNTFSPFISSISSLDYVRVDYKGWEPPEEAIRRDVTLQHGSSEKPVRIHRIPTWANDSVWSMDKTSSYILQSGDELQFNFFNLDEINGELSAYNEDEIAKQVKFEEIGESNGTLFWYLNIFRTVPKPQFLFINHFPSNYYNGTGSYYLNIGTPYLTDVISNNKPWFNSYDKFAEDLRPHNQNYSIIPEFKISDHIPYYILDKGGDFSQPITYNYLNVEGFETEEKFIDGDETTIKGEIIQEQELDKRKINYNYNSSDKYNNKIELQHIALANPSKFTLKFDGLKKLRPYRGFYPQQKVVELAKIFSDSVYGDTNTKVDFQMFASSSKHFLNSTAELNTDLGTPYDQQIISLLQPFFAPGILFNSLRSGLAVDWPAYVGTYSDYTSPTPPSFYTTASNVPLSSSSLTYVLGQNFDLRIPFKSILNPNNAIPKEMRETGSLFYVNPTFYSSDVNKEDPAYPFYRIEEKDRPWLLKNNLYQLAINNFMSEVVDFFIQDSKLTNFTSQTQNKFKNFRSGSVYSMYVKLTKPKELSLFGNNENGTNRGASFFGPPSKFFINGEVQNDYSPTTSIGVYKKEDLLQDVAFAPYLPPYYFGESIAKIIYTASSDNPTVTDIINNLTIEFSNTSLRKQLDKLTNSDYETSTAFANSMNLNASIDFKQKINNLLLSRDQNGNLIQAVDSTTSDTDQWSIQTLFEAPILQFNNEQNNAYVIEEENSVTSGSFKNSLKIINEIGLWSGYGSVPNKNQSISITLENGPENNDLLANCGFDVDGKSTKEELGKIAQERIISEAIIAIPYCFGIKSSEQFAEIMPAIDYENGASTQTGGLEKAPKYFKIQKQIINELLGFEEITYDSQKVSFSEFETKIRNSNLDNIIIKTMKLMLDYNLPPHLNWVRNRNIEPFVLYIAKFEETLQEQNKDISNIWQGLMPKCARELQLDSVSVSHGFSLSEFYHGKRIPEKTSFKIFKIKKRAIYDYAKIINSRQNSNFLEINLNDGQQYSYNYPYDDFSLIEQCKVSFQIELSRPNKATLAVG